MNWAVRNPAGTRLDSSLVNKQVAQQLEDQSYLLVAFLLTLKTCQTRRGRMRVFTATSSRMGVWRRGRVLEAPRKHLVSPTRGFSQESRGRRVCSTASRPVRNRGRPRPEDMSSLSS